MRPHIRPYIEISERVAEFYQAERLRNADIDTLQLMWADFDNAPHQHFYIKEVAELTDGTFVVPMKWICVLEDGREVYCADVHRVHINPEVCNKSGDPP